MRRIKTVAMIMATSLIAVAVFGSGSASADVLCKKVSLTYDCAAGDTWGVGSQFHAENNPADYNGDLELLGALGGTSPSIVVAKCAFSEMDTTLTSAGGLFKYPFLDITKLSFGSCGDDSMSVASAGGGTVTTLYEGSPSKQGLFKPSELKINVTSNWAGSNFPISNCTYDIVGTARIEGAQTNELGVDRLVFNETQAKLVSYSGSSCPQKARLSGQYYFVDLEPNGIYVLRE
jgi:hypothetical protein